MKIFKKFGPNEKNPVCIFLILVDSIIEIITEKG